MYEYRLVVKSRLLLEEELKEFEVKDWHLNSFSKISESQIAYYFERPLTE